jgi:hypothetical protein
VATHLTAGGLAARLVNILFQVCLPPSRLRAPVSLAVSAVSSRTLVNNAGWYEGRKEGGTVPCYFENLKGAGETDSPAGRLLKKSLLKPAKRILEDKSVWLMAYSL